MKKINVKVLALMYPNSMELLESMIGLQFNSLYEVEAHISACRGAL